MTERTLRVNGKPYVYDRNSKICKKCRFMPDIFRLYYNYCPYCGEKLEPYCGEKLEPLKEGDL